MRGPGRRPATGPTTLAGTPPDYKPPSDKTRQVRPNPDGIRPRPPVRGAGVQRIVRADAGAGGAPVPWALARKEVCHEVWHEVWHDGGMQITSRQVFQADPATTVSMLSTRDFIDEIASRAQATSHTVDIAGNSTRVQMVVPAPREAQGFVGTSLDVTTTVDWGDPAADGSRHGTFAVEVAKLPVQLNGTVTAVPEAATTVVTYDGDLQVKIPLIGRQIEKTAAPAITQALEYQQDVGNEWLAARR